MSLLENVIFYSCLGLNQDDIVHYLAEFNHIVFNQKNIDRPKTIFGWDLSSLIETSIPFSCRREGLAGIARSSNDSA